MMWHGFMTVKMNGRSASEFSISHQRPRGSHLRAATCIGAGQSA